MVSLVEWAARRLIIIIVTTGTVSVIGGLVIGRYVVPDNGSNGPDTASVAPQTSPSATPPGVTPTLVPSPKPSSQPANTAATTSVPGVPTRINEFGIPVGYPHTEAGAVSACANYDAITGNLRNREPSRIRSMFNSISATPESAKRLSEMIISNDMESAKAYGASSIQSPNFTLIGRIAGYAVRSYDENKADVTLWGAVAFGIYGNQNPNLAPRQGWGTDYCQVVWSSGDWKLKDEKDGPSEPAITERAAENFKEFLLVGAGT
ncbi:hypothetical protein E0F15_17225 [Frankia sp. B2]|uniref:hypothetical protein n=1 Tax=unclassified Frankia TaxID=2632575 RepID=UPI0004DD6784|nr:MULTISPECIES: hypothetical protein [unclassified Frankia]KEZ35053.1 hypothetical protein CEDDRAFT_03603 [Frankia sp. CeD]TFE26818.1 hypothetical protein E0F15_17225 [Frankia sp. B2]